MVVTRRLQAEYGSDIWELAALLIEKHSELAPKIVFEMAIDSLNAGDLERSAKWALVGSAITELQKGEKRPLN